MARPLDYILREITRVADELDVDPRDLKRTDFLPNTDITYHDLGHYGGFAKLRSDAAHSSGIAPFKDLVAARGVDLRNNYVRSLERKVADSEYLSNKLLKGIEEIFEKNPVKLPRTKKKATQQDSKRLITLLWSDLHFGLEVDPREITTNKFTWSIAARRMAETCRQTVMKLNEGPADLQIVLNGDIIAGVIHLNEARLAELQEQIYGATAILAKAIGFLADYFPKVRVLCLPGNHDRSVYKGNERTLSQRWNSHAHSIYMGLRIWFREFKHVSFDIPMTSYGTYQTPGGETVLATHGDVEPSVSNVSKNFDVSKATSSVNNFQLAGLTPKISAVLYGHWHQPSMFLLPNGCYVIVNGSLISTDPYAQNAVGICKSVPAQVLFESTETEVIKAFKVLHLDSADENTDLDEIISIPNIDSGGLIRF